MDDQTSELQKMLGVLTQLASNNVYVQPCILYSVNKYVARWQRKIESTNSYRTFAESKLDA